MCKKQVPGIQYSCLCTFFLSGLVAKNEFLNQAYVRLPNAPYGGFYGGGGYLFVCQLIEVLVIFGWVTATMGPLFFGLHLLGLLRVPPDEEIAGMDMTKHGGSAYNVDNASAPPEGVALYTPEESKPAEV